MLKVRIYLTKLDVCTQTGLNLLIVRAKKINVRNPKIGIFCDYRSKEASSEIKFWSRN